MSKINITGTHKNLRAHKKRSVNFLLKFKKDDVALDITDWTVYFTLKENKTDSDANAKLKKDITDHLSPTSGQSKITLTSDDMDLDIGSYYYGIDVKDDSTPCNCMTIYHGKFNIERATRESL